MHTFMLHKMSNGLNIVTNIFWIENVPSSSFESKKNKLVPICKSKKEKRVGEVLLKFLQDLFLGAVGKVQKANSINKVNLISFLNPFNWIPQRKDIDGT